MKKLNIEDLKLELTLLQRADTEEALKQGFTEKDKWILHKINSKENDEIAEAIIDISKRYNVPVYNLAQKFDKSGFTMYLRVANQMKKAQVKTKKAA